MSIKSPFTAITPKGALRDFVVSVGDPLQRGEGTWATVVSLEDLYPELQPIIGGDALQSWSLALLFVRDLLNSYTDGGGQICFKGTKDEIPIDAYFPGKTGEDDEE